MTKSVDHLLDQRRRRVTRGQRTGNFFSSMILHGTLVAAFVLIPELVAEPSRPVTYVAVTVVPPAALGLPDVPAPSRPSPEPPPPEPRPEPAKPAPARAPDPEVPVIRAEKEDQPASQPAGTSAAPAGDPLKRRGSTQGNPLGASTSKAVLGVEDPNFTYGYYLDRVVSILSANWLRPQVGSEIENALFYFRIRRDGSITELRLTQTSQSDIFDAAARRAIEASSPLPPLPRGYKRDYLGITLVVK